MIKHILLMAFVISLVACGYQLQDPTTVNIQEEQATYFPVASATVNISSYGELAQLKKERFNYANLLLTKAVAQVAQGSAVVSVTYNNPSVVAFALNTSNFGNALTVTGDELNLGSLSVSALDDNTLRVCTGVGAPGNKCNRLYIRVFTLGTASGGITGVPGLINQTSGYGVDVFAANLPTPLGFNSSATAANVTNAATVYTVTIPNNTNRVRLNQLSIPTIPIKADLSNAGNGMYEMNLVVQYALGYVP